MTEPDDDYPRQWQPRERRDRDEQRTEMELAAAAMSDDEFARFVDRTRGQA